jgi:hypothetical protein
VLVVWQTCRLDSTGATRACCKSSHPRVAIHSLAHAYRKRVSKPFAGTELIYCVLSLTAKVYLGTFLLINVIMVDGGVEAALANGGVPDAIAN